ncbi:hypothetical protein SAMN05444141_103260 [Pseudovibrio denitrificans]|uniref:Signal peptidase I n=1 Tax=Pseudovibrio denitrificans TaxID=258256 RepID=A0A1I7APJ3_9HYPH|nr:hypothetical protein [Pseudovibrio denitrificans]SFT76880.1 hypothetical protein SAMN05444141_103260 [Pseudovibrio denitrificans]
MSSEKDSGFFLRENLLGITPWIAFFGALMLLGRFYDTLPTSFDKTLTGLEPRSVYLQMKGNNACVGDVVFFRSLEKKAFYVRQVSASSGDIFHITPTSYAINEQSFTHSPKWQEAALKQSNGKTDITIPEEHYLIVNRDFGADWAKNDWAYEIIPQAQIRKRVTHIIFTPNLSRVGEKISNDCSA